VASRGGGPLNMCGLAALIEPGRRFDDALLAGMEQDLFHRGPDSGGRLSEPGVALVFRRLAILDPTPGSDQPMTDPTGRCTLVFNGEIYNYRALRAALAQAGVALRTDGDTEAILEGYIRWGEGVLDRLEGMYAFALVDRRENALIAARDPFGIKPLYLMHRGGMVALASEMRPFARLARPEPDPDALAELLTFRWAAGRLGNHKGIDRVPGGTVLRVSLADASVTERRFCDPLDTLRPDEDLDAREADARAAAVLRESVRAHLASDVGYTVQLSGGVDSSVVTALATGEGKGPPRTFGIDLGDFEHDEGRWRRAVVERYGIDHCEVTLDGRDFADALPRAVAHMEGPSPHLGCVMLMLLCREIRKHGKVVLTGEGADEFFGGYRRYATWRKTRWQERAGRLAPWWMWPARRPFHELRRIAGVDAAAYGGVYDEFRVVQGLFPALVPKPGAREAASRRFRDFRDRLMAVDQTAYLESLLMRQDKMSMAESVEARVPFVHLPLARVLNALPRDVRVPGGETKPILKRIAEPLLPHDLLYRRKVGLLLPFGDWLRDDAALGRYLDDLAAPDCRLAAYAEPRRLRRAVDDFRTGRVAGLEWVMMRLVNVETWLRSLPAGPA
jgi:asparagine synthase (glutamine-hydrolysing)